MPLPGEEKIIEEFARLCARERTSIGTLIRGRSTLDQYGILMRADALFADRCGRYYAGPLLPDEVLTLDPPKPEQHTPAHRA